MGKVKNVKKAINKTVKNNASTREDKIEVEGKVVEVLKGGDYIVELPNGHTV